MHEGDTMPLKSLIALFNRERLDEYNIGRIYSEALRLVENEQELYRDHTYIPTQKKHSNWSNEEDINLLDGTYGEHRSLQTARQHLSDIWRSMGLTKDDAKLVSKALKKFSETRGS